MKGKITTIRKIISDFQTTKIELQKWIPANWKELYNELDAEHRRAFWRTIIKGVKIDENGAITW